jgi:predicted enzyme related to lactoylglutathione lyase
VLGFTAIDSVNNDSTALLKSGPLHLVLTEGDAPLPPAGAAEVIINMSVADLPATVDYAIAGGAIVTDTAVREFAHGTFVRIRDPFGNRINLLDVGQSHEDPNFTPRVFNIGVTQDDLPQAESFYAALGFVPLTRDYLPDVLPLAMSGAAMLILHNEADACRVPGTRNFRIILSVEDVGHCAGLAEEQRMSVVARGHSTSYGTFLILRDPSGNELRLTPLRL